MAVPSKKELHRPILEIAAETGGKIHRREIRDILIDRLALSEVDLADQSASGSNRFRDRFSFACQDLKLSGLLSYPERGHRQITDAGRRFLKSHEGEITDWDLRQLQSKSPPDQSSATPFDHTTWQDSDSIQDSTPKEVIDLGYQQLQEALRADMLDNILTVAPDRFERLVVDLLVRMGYGEGTVIGRSGDGGIDGVINQDALGLEKIYVQAKRYTAGSVGEPEIRNFSGSLDARGASKGVFITTSTFSSTARQTAQTISAGNKFIRLVDGAELAQLMIRHGVGVVTEYTYEIKKLDGNYFSGDT